MPKLSPVFDAIRAAGGHASAVAADIADATAAEAHIVAVQGVGEKDVGAGVEAGDEFAGLMVEVRLHREPP